MAEHPYVTVDTEFLRESTFWLELCLLQLACPSDAYIVDVLAKSIELTPFFELMANHSVRWVFHAARQDIEIIYNLGGLIPHPVFDTQVAAMVCGYGDSISYDRLVFRIANQHIDKIVALYRLEAPATDREATRLCALADVTHLCAVYQSIKANLEEQGRALGRGRDGNPHFARDLYDLPPGDAWQRLKLRVRKPREFALLQKLAEWRERTARSSSVPRGRVIKDEAIYEICGHPAENRQTSRNCAACQRGFDRNRYGNDLLAVVKAYGDAEAGSAIAAAAASGA
ncbi:MAG: HRDC domain-containing protein [Nitratireductor sp.]